MEEFIKDKCCQSYNGINIDINNLINKKSIEGKRRYGLYGNTDTLNKSIENVIQPQNLTIFIDYVYISKKYTFTDYNKAIMDNKYFEATKCLKQLLTNNTNYKGIKNIINDEFMKVYSLLFDKCTYSVLHSINELIIFEYIDYIENNKDDIIELHREIKNNVYDNTLLYLWKYCV